MPKDKLKKEYRKLLTKIYGSEVVDFYLNSESDNICSTQKEIDTFYKKYLRFEPVNKTNEDGHLTQLKLKGCGKCISKERFVLQQDFPGWIKKLDEIKYMIIGKEISSSVHYHTHIAYDYYPSSQKIEKGIISPITGKLDLFFKNIWNSAYITDIAKCLCTNKNYARKKCVHYLKKEIQILFRLNSRLLVIIQGIGDDENSVWGILKKEMDGKEIHETEMYYGGKRQYKILRFGYITPFPQNKIPIIIFPHTSLNANIWKYFNENQEIYKAKITKFLPK